MFLLMHLLCPLHWQSTSSGTKRLKYDLSLPSKGKHLFNKPTPILRQKSLCSCKFPTEETIVARLDIINPLLTPPPPLPPLPSCDRWTTFKFPLIFISAFFDHYFQALLFVQRLKTSLTCNLRFFMKLKSCVCQLNTTRYCCRCFSWVWDYICGICEILRILQSI